MTTEIAVPNATVEQLARCPLGCGAKRAGIQHGSIYFECGTRVDVTGEKPLVYRAEGCIELVAGKPAPKVKK